MFDSGTVTIWISVAIIIGPIRQTQIATDKFKVYLIWRFNLIFNMNFKGSVIGEKFFFRTINFGEHFPTF